MQDRFYISSKPFYTVRFYLNTKYVSFTIPECDCETEYFKTKHCNLKNTRFLNKHVAYLRSVTQWKKKKKKKWQEFDGSELDNI